LIRAVIVEDEGVAARRLEKLLATEWISVVETLPSNRHLQAYLATERAPDLYFMDIHLNDGIVFETLQTVEVKVPIVFTTAYDEFAIRAFKQQSVDYLLKPIEVGELRGAIEKFKLIYRSGAAALDVTALSELIIASASDASAYRERLRVQVGPHLRSIKINEVQLFYSADKITFLQLTNGRSYPIEWSLDKLEPELNPTQFHRVNRAQIVNIDHIRDIITYSNSRLQLTLEHAKHPPIVVARERVKGFKEWLG